MTSYSDAFNLEVVDQILPDMSIASRESRIGRLVEKIWPGAGVRAVSSVGYRIGQAAISLVCLLMASESAI